MAKRIDTWITGDLPEDLKRIRLTIKADNGQPWGVAMGLNYYTTLEVRKVGTSVVFAYVNGTWLDANQSQASFVVDVTFNPDLGTASQEYEFLLTLTNTTNGKVTWASSDGAGTPWSFLVIQWP